jgi:hypothetical protein
MPEFDPITRGSTKLGSKYCTTLIYKFPTFEETYYAIRLFSAFRLVSSCNQAESRENEKTPFSRISRIPKTSPVEARNATLRAQRNGTGWNLGSALQVGSTACWREGESVVQMRAPALRARVRGVRKAESTPQQGLEHGVPNAVGRAPTRGAWHRLPVPSNWLEPGDDGRCCA